MMLCPLRLQPLLQALLQQQQTSGAPISLALTDSHGELLHFTRMAGASLHSGELARNKAYTAARDRQSTRDLGAWSRNSGRTLPYWSDARFTGFAGGVPLWHEGAVVAAVGISGLSEEEDHHLATELTHALGQHLISNGDLNRGIS